MSAQISYRVLVTASRDWENTPYARAVMRDALLNHTQNTGVPTGQILVIHGAQGTYRNGHLVQGGDMILHEVATELGMCTDAHPADWYGACRYTCKPRHRRPDRTGRLYCPAAGNYRNQEMVDLQPPADVCIGFPLSRSVGTRDCLRRAAAAGIVVVSGTPAVTR